MNATLRLGAFLLLILARTVHAADLKFASIFSDGMVVQRNQKIPVWGQGIPDSTVEVEWNRHRARTDVGADGWWRVELDPTPAGGPFTLKASAAGKTITVQDVLCGDVWLCSGQSNMQMTAGECVGGEQAAARAAAYPNLRLLTVGRGGADEPKQTFDGKWKRGTPETAGKFSAVGYFFALMLLQDPALEDVPVGLIDSSFGGTAGEGWTPQAELAWQTPEQRSGSMFNIGPAALYNAMIAPLGRSGLAGVLWYQGEANAGKPEVYPKVLTSLIQGWRQQFGRPELPFFIVELPPFADQFGSHYFTWTREAQATVAKMVPHCELVTTVNTTDGASLHPKTKLEIGRRAALLALRDVYGQKVVAQGPVFQSARADGARLRVAFDTGGQGLASRHPDQLGGFQLAGADGGYYFADASIEGEEVVLESKRVAAPKTVRYAWTAVPRADLVNRDGLPAAPFRTDDLPATDNEFLPQPVTHRLVTKAVDLVVDGRGNIRSLGIGGQQFLSNSFGGSAGTCFPSAHGYQELDVAEEVQPDRLLFHNQSLSLEITGDDEKTTWTITNDADKEEAQFRITLANGVKATPKDGAVELERVFARARVEGAGELRPPGPDGQTLVTTVPAHATAVLKISREK